ncbi:hypothetical protein KM043_008111 [Ampulex compressa]|nr:hypothetical protein KM043_008111 [Ampulex compressa]
MRKPREFRQLLTWSQNNGSSGVCTPTKGIVSQTQARPPIGKIDHLRARNRRRFVANVLGGRRARDKLAVNEDPATIPGTIRPSRNLSAVWPLVGDARNALRLTHGPPVIDRDLESRRFDAPHKEPDITMSQQQLTSDLDVPESPQHSCQCSAMSSIDSMRTPRDRSERSVGSTRISNSQDIPRGLEALQSAFEPIRRLESPLSHQESQQICLENTRNVDILEHQASLSPNSRSIEGQGAILSRHGHNLSCSPRNLDLSRNLAFEAARRVQESSSLQDSPHGLASTPSPLLESTSGLLEPSAKDLDKQLEDHAALSQKQTPSGKDKLKNIQQVLNPYQHHHETTPADRNVHGHFHGDAHAHVHKHAENFRGATNLDTGDGLMGFQQHQRQHTHHHHGNTKTANVSHHHGPTSVHHQHTSQAGPGHHHGNLAGNLSSHVHGNSGSLSGSGSMSHASQSGSANSASHHHSNPTATSIVHRSSPTSHHRLSGANHSGHHPTNPSFAGEHHGTSSALSGASSNSSMMNHGGSPAVHRHVVNANSSLSSTPLAGHHHGSSSGSLTGHSSVNHHHVSSGISCESSSSNANTRTHSRLDHVHEHHHHLQTVHSLHSTHPEPRQRDRAPSSLDHHGHHHGHIHSHGHPHSQNSDIKNTSLIGVDAIQVSAPSKSKCQCHVVEQAGGNKRGQESEGDGSIEVTSRTHQPPALPPRPPPRPARRYETMSSNQCKLSDASKSSTPTSSCQTKTAAYPSIEFCLPPPKYRRCIYRGKKNAKPQRRQVVDQASQHTPRERTYSEDAASFPAWDNVYSDARRIQHLR